MFNIKIVEGMCALLCCTSALSEIPAPAPALVPRREALVPQIEALVPQRKAQMPQREAFWPQTLPPREAHSP